MKIRAILLLSILVIPVVAGAQEAEKPEIRPVQYYIGLQPGIDRLVFEQFDGYAEYAWDIDLVPVTVEYALNRHWGLCLHTILNLENRPYQYPSVLSSFGIEVALPYYLSLKNSEEGHRGFFVGPTLTPGYNLLNKYHSLKVGGSVGYSLLFANKWSFSVAVQAGWDRQKYPGSSFVRYVSYTTPVLGLGIWL